MMSQLISCVQELRKAIAEMPSGRASSKRGIAAAISSSSLCKPAADHCRSDGT